MDNNNEKLRNVAEVAAKIMGEALKGNQHKIDANKNDKVDAQDFKILRGEKKMKEEVEAIDEVAAEDHSAQQVYDKAHMAYMNKHHKNVPADKQKAAESEAHKHASAIMKAKYPHHTASKGEGQVYRLSKEEIELLDELNKSTLGSYVNASARDAVHRTAKEVETGRLDKLADKRMKGIKLATKKLAKEETVEEGYYKDIDTNRKEDERLTAQKKKDLPFTPDKKKTKVATAGKFGYGYSAARHLARQGMAGMAKEEVDQVEEAITKTSTGYIHHARPGVYGGSEKEKHVVDTLTGPKKSELEKIEKEKKMKKFSEMLDLINSQGLKALSEMIKEEPDNETFTKELKDQEAKAAGKKKQPELSKGDVVAVKQEEVELDEALPSGVTPPPKYNSKPKVSGVPQNSMKTKQVGTTTTSHGTPAPITKRVAEESEQVEERSLTEPEMKKKEQIVKSMKKGIAGFKERYGERAKNVMYATATKRAMGEEVEQIQEEAPEGYQRRDGRLIPKIHSKMTPHEHGYDYTMQSIEDAPSKAKIHSQHKEIVKDNPHPQGSKEHKDWEAGTNKAKADHLKDFS